MTRIAKKIFSAPALFAATTALLAGCAMDPGSGYYGYSNEGHGYPVEWRHDHHNSTTATIEYQPPELLAQNEIDQAKKENRPPDLSHVPKGGRVKVHLHGHDRHAGNPKNYDFSVTDKDGHVIQRETGANTPSPAPKNLKAGPPVFEGTHNIDLQTPVKDPIQVNVVNRMDKGKEEYTIRRPESKQPASQPAVIAPPNKLLPPAARPRLIR